MKNIGKTATLNSREIFIKFSSISIGWLPTINSWNNFRRDVFTTKLRSYPIKWGTQLHYTIHPKILALKTHLIISSVKLSVTTRVNPPYLHCIHMVEKYAYSRGVIHSLTNNANMVGLPSILRVEFRSLIRCYEGVVFHRKFRRKT